MVDATQSFAEERYDKLPIFGVIADTFRIFGKAPLVFMLLAAVGQLPVVAQILIRPPVATTFTITTAVVVVVNLLIALLLNTAMVSIAVSLADNRPAPLGEALRLGARRYFAMLGTTFLAMLAIYGGMILLVVPGLMLTCVYAVASPVCAIEAMGPVASLKRSALLTKFTRWRIFVAYLIFYVPLTIIGGATTYFTAARGHMLMGQWIGGGLQLFGMPLSTIFPAAIYLELLGINRNSIVAQVFE